MAVKLHKNAILVGYIDCFCLVCEIHFKGKADAYKHIDEPEHLKILQSTSIVEKFIDDNILKVKKGYYCIFCNTVLTTASKVSLHIVESLHKRNKGDELIKREGTIITFHDLLINENAWNGIVGDMCALCNVEFEDKSAHKTEPTHLFNLTKNAVEFGLKKEFYRKVDETTIQCIICNNLLPLTNLTTHIEEREHNDLLLKSAEAYQEWKKKLDSQLTNKSIGYDQEIVKDCKNTSISDDSFSSAEYFSDESDTLEAVADKTKILDSVNMFEKNEVNIDFLNDTAVCKKCLENVDFDFKTIVNHIEEHKSLPRKKDVVYVPFQCEVDMKCDIKKLHTTENVKKHLPAIDTNNNIDNANDKKSELDDDHNLSGAECNENTEIDDPVEFAKHNKLTYNKGNNNAYCRLCETKVPSTLRSMKEHVAGNQHKKKINLTKHSQTYTPRTSSLKMTFEEFLDEAYTIGKFLEQETVVNQKFCMETISFQMVTKIGARLRCHLCETSLWREEFDEHKRLNCHLRVMLKTTVITKYHSEFIREVRAGLYHCGFCNLIEASEQALIAHLDSSEHKLKKITFEIRLQRILPIIENYKEARIRDMFMRAMFGRSFFH